MSFEFQWNPYADQPHNVAPHKERLKHHLKHAGTYMSLFTSNLRRAAPILANYRQYRKKMYKEQVQISDPFAISVSPSEGREEEVVELLKETNIQKTLVRIPSWERRNLTRFEKFSKLLFARGIELTVALLQNREDVLHPSRWHHFLEEVFSRFGQISSLFEIGHAWNRTKWGVWDYEEYLRLARPAVPLAEKYGVKLVGPAVIDFEFHLYPPVLDVIPFDRVSSLLYVDRVGAPEKKQFGWDTSRKLALLKAVVDGSTRRKHNLWITEVNWPLKGTGKYSPASGKPNVSEEEQADFLVRYYILCVTSGFVERIYWWQLVAPGYGLVDSRDNEWRKRPGFYAMKTMVTYLKESAFLKKIHNPRAKIFSFRKGEEDFVVCWTKGEVCEHLFPGKVVRVVRRDGEEIPRGGDRVKIDGSPIYVFLK